MPVQINEVIVRAVVNPANASSGNTMANCPPEASGSGTGSDIAEQVLEIIKEKKER